MKPLDVDFRSHRGPPRWAWQFLGGLVAIAIGAGVLATVAHQRLAAVRADEAALRSRLNPPTAAPVTSAPPAYEASARTALSQAQAQWPQLLTALESVQIDGVRPVDVHISTKQRTVRVELEFVQFSDVLRYLDALNAGSAVPRWQLIQARNEASAGTAGSATAAIQAGW